MSLVATYAGMSGTSGSDRMNLIHRRSADGAQVESWVIERDEKRVASRIRTPGLITGLWRSEAGRGFCVTKDTIYAFRLQRAGWRSYAVDWSPRGVYGIDDRNVWVWGEQYGAGTLYRWNGGQFSGNWDEVEDCPGEIRAMHGTSPQNLFAVGDGSVARFDGSSWSYEGINSEARLCSVFALPDGTAYACGEDGGLWQRSGIRWSLVLKHDAPLNCVAPLERRAVGRRAGQAGAVHPGREEPDLKEAQPARHPPRLPRSADVLLRADRGPHGRWRGLPRAADRGAPAAEAQQRDRHRSERLSPWAE